MVAGSGVDFTDFCAEGKGPDVHVTIARSRIGCYPALSQNASANTPERKADECMNDKRIQ